MLCPRAGRSSGRLQDQSGVVSHTAEHHLHTVCVNCLRCLSDSDGSGEDSVVDKEKLGARGDMKQVALHSFQFAEDHDTASKMQK